jgi:sugar phosphate isomerase/epimerase
MITRRTFIQRTAAVPAGAAISPMFQRRQPYKMGLQLYTVRAPMARDAEATLKSIAAMGYEEVETYGFDPATTGYYGMPAKAFRERLAAHKLTSPSGHYDLNRHVSTDVAELTRYMDQCIRGAQALGQSYITWPLIDPPDRTTDKFKIVADRLNLIGRQAQKAGLQVAYHNHDFEFVERDGQLGYDIILKNTDPALVKMQMDLYWIARGSKATANEWFKRQPGRFVMWHVKDMDRTSRDYTELGNGTIDFTKIWPDAKLAGLKHFFVEQGGNFTQDPMRSVAVSAEYVKKVLFKLP